MGLVLSGGGAKGLAHIGVIKVLEEAGIPIDFIGGTSMGCIIGGLYAIGYSSNQLDSIVRTMDWDEVLSDKVPRRSLSILEKDENLRYLFSFPIREKKISMPAAIVSGQNISMKLAQLTSPVFDQTDFSKFHIPFLCIATDIENGKQMVIRNGNLASAMRGSMAIPTVFTPEEYQGVSLLDGGLINNFPVQEVKAMGADIIIGVDVGFRFYSHNELNSLVRIIEQSIFMHSLDELRINRDSCQIYIKPDLIGFNVSSFSKADTLISRGERAAMLQFSELKKIGKYLKSFGDSSIKPQVQSEIHVVSKIMVKELLVNGLSNVPREFIFRKIPFLVPGEVTPDEIESFIETIYGTAFFERVTYRFEPIEGGVRLVLNAKERNTNYFRVGLHYDSDLKTSLLLNTTYRNFLLRGSKISFDLSLGDNPMISALLYRNTGWNWSNEFMVKRRLVPDYGLQIKAHTMDFYTYRGNLKIASYRFSDLTTDLFIQSNPGNNLSFKLGLKFDFSYMTDQINSGIHSRTESNLFSPYLNYHRDSYNHAFFPTKGAKVNLNFRYAQELDIEKKGLTPRFIQATYSGNYTISMGTRVTLLPGIALGSLLGDSIPSHYRFYLGGQSSAQLPGYVSFVGLNFMQITGQHFAAAKLNLQWEMWNDNFLVFKSSLGKAEASRNLMTSTKNWALGYGVAFGYRSPIGPMELSFMSSNKNPKLMMFVNIGYNL